MDPQRCYAHRFMGRSPWNMAVRESGCERGSSFRACVVQSISPRWARHRPSETAFLRFGVGLTNSKAIPSRKYQEYYT
jgi:hypothetical protein